MVPSSGFRMAARAGTAALVGVALSCWALPASAAAQGEPPAVEWEKVFGVEGEDRCWDAQQTKDGGYILAGMSDLDPVEACWRASLIRIDAKGEFVWQKTYRDPCDVHTHTHFYSVREADDGGFIASGLDLNVDFPEQTGALLLKTDANGVKVWSRTFAETEQFNSATQTRDGGYIVLGHYTFSPNAVLHLVKTDGSGAPEWIKTFDAFGGESPDEGCEVQQTADGGYVLLGRAYFAGTDAWEIYLIKTDASGTEEWSRTFGREGIRYGNSVQQTQDGGYIVAGMAGVELSDFAYLIKTDGTGNEVWSRTLQRGTANSVWQTRDGGYIVGGQGRSGQDGVKVVRTDGLGNPMWVGSFGAQEVYAVQQTLDGGYMVAGKVTSDSLGTRGQDVYLLKLAPETVGPAAFQRGDSDAGGALNLTDAVFTLSYLFQSGPAPACLDAADADDNGKVQITDAIFTLSHLFLGGPPLPAPSGSCGTDPSEDELGCASYGTCGGG